ncbi:MAG: ABC transporter permease [Eubacteriales bacterium]|nr:ABC transporter permease [Eubacteriales bacterium]
MSDQNTGNSASLHRLTPIYLAKRNLLRQSGRSAFLILITCLASLFLFLSSYLGLCLNLGLHSLGERLGADILLVPAGYDSKIQSAILRGEPTDAYFPERELDELAKIEGIEAYSPQLYVQTLSASCCSYPLQLIGFDPRTDFVIQAWMKTRLKAPLEKNQLVVGHHIAGEAGGELRFFGKVFQVAARMDKSGFGFDTSVFMTLDTARELMNEPIFRGAHPGLGDEAMVSTALIRIAADQDVETMRQTINDAYKGRGLYALTTKNMMRETRDKFKSLSVFIVINSALLWLSSLLILYAIYMSILRERRGELAALRVSGASRRFVNQCLRAEAWIASAIGALLGLLLAMLLALVLRSFLERELGMPWLDPALGRFAVLAVSTFVLSLVVGPLAIALGARRYAQKNLNELLESEGR